MFVKFVPSLQKWYISEDGGVSWYWISKAKAKKIQETELLD